MDKRILLSINCVSVLALAALLGAAGCGVEENTEDATGGTTGSGGSGVGGGGQTGGTGTGGADGSVCQHTPIPPNGRITDFAELEGVTFTGDVDWGNDESLTGGTFFYQEGDDSILTATVANGVMNLSGNIPAESYAGFGMWFGPCSDASAWSGVTFTMTGDLGETALQLQLQESKNYPQASDKGECQFQSDETKWEECTNNASPPNSDIGQGLILPEDGSALAIPWASFTGGTNEPLDSSELLGMQWQFNCGTDGAGPDDACVVNVNMDDVMFYTE
ncbi:MAG: hypothetical protein JW751_22940 [Polyangiaceae bacterium]|nr:hypothetical protein [Polyangiaceae bacterium]